MLKTVTVNVLESNYNRKVSDEIANVVEDSGEGRFSHRFSVHFDEMHLAMAHPSARTLATARRSHSQPRPPRLDVIMNPSLIFSFTFILTLLIFSCSSDSDDNSSEVWEQKSEMLTNWADNFIIPSYTTLTNNLVLLEESGNTFASSRNQQNLENLRIYKTNTI